MFSFKGHVKHIADDYTGTFPIVSAPLGVACHVPGDVVDAVVWWEELIQVDHSRVQLFTQYLLMLPFFSFLRRNKETHSCHMFHVTDPIMNS